MKLIAKSTMWILVCVGVVFGILFVEEWLNQRERQAFIEAENQQLASEWIELSKNPSNVLAHMRQIVPEATNFQLGKWSYGYRPEINTELEQLQRADGNWIDVNSFSIDPNKILNVYTYVDTYELSEDGGGIGGANGIKGHHFKSVVFKGSSGVWINCKGPDVIVRE